MSVTDQDRERAHAILREWLLATPAVEASVRTVGAQRELEERIAAALADERARAQETDGE